MSAKDRINSRLALADRMATATAARSLSEAGTRLHHTRERVHKAWRVLTDGLSVLVKNRRLHEINGAPTELFERLDVPKWAQRTQITLSPSD